MISSRQRGCPLFGGAVVRSSTAYFSSTSYMTVLSMHYLISDNLFSTQICTHILASCPTPPTCSRSNIQVMNDSSISIDYSKGKNPEFNNLVRWVRGRLIYVQLFPLDDEFLLYTAANPEQYTPDSCRHRTV